MRRGQFDFYIPSSRVWVFQPVIESIIVSKIEIIIQIVVIVIIGVSSAGGRDIERHSYDYMFQERDWISIRETALCHSEGKSSTAVDVPVCVSE